MATATSLRGKCLCGAVEFEVTGPTPKLYQCHCTLCRKQGGSSSNTATIVPLDSVRWLAGQDLVSSYVKPTGFRSDFCSKCGSPVPNPLRSTRYYWVPAGLFEGTEKLEVVVHLYVDSRAPWDTAPLIGAQFDTMPEMREFFRLLHEGRR
jgi:hypothetical protein